MKQTDPQMKIRLPPDLKDRIEQAAKRYNRSMNAEIVVRLEYSFSETKAEVSETLSSLKESLERSENALKIMEAARNTIENIQLETDRLRLIVENKDRTKSELDK